MSCTKKRGEEHEEIEDLFDAEGSLDFSNLIKHDASKRTASAAADQVSITLKEQFSTQEEARQNAANKRLDESGAAKCFQHDDVTSKENLDYSVFEQLRKELVQELASPVASEDYIKEVERKRTIIESSSLWEDEDRCKKLFKTGISATKYNYSNNLTKKVTITLSDDMKYLSYTSVEPPQSCLQQLKGQTRSLLIAKDLVGIFYGGVMTNFKRHLE